MSSNQVSVGDFTPRSQLSKHFQFWEMTKSDTADASDIDNIPSHKEIALAQHLAREVLDKVRVQFGIVDINSWFRCESLERKVAASGYLRWLENQGKPDTYRNWRKYFEAKQHPQGAAADIEARSASNTEVYEWIKANCEFDQLILENVTDPDNPRSGWVHVSCKPSGNRKEAFTI